MWSSSHFLQASALPQLMHLSAADRSSASDLTPVGIFSMAPIVSSILPISPARSFRRSIQFTLFLPSQPSVQVSSSLTASKSSGQDGVQVIQGQTMKR